MKYTVSLTRNHEFRRLYGKGQSAASQTMVVYCRRNGRERLTGRAPGSGDKLPANRLGLTASTKLGNAVHRNRIRRRLREAYRLTEPQLKQGFDIVIVARVRAFDAPFSVLLADFRRLARKTGLLEGSQPEVVKKKPPGERSR